MKQFLLLSLICIGFACRNNKSEEPAVEQDSAAGPDHFIWQSTLNDSGKLELVPSWEISPDSLQPALVIDQINRSNQQMEYGKVALVFVKTSGDTAYIKIPDATYLTQQMGSTGPGLFFSGVVFTLTALPGLNYVNFDFAAGDHASPGTYSRESFKNL